MKEKIFEIIDEQTSPLFRIMSVINFDDPPRRQFANNIISFHIGNGYLLSVAHNLRPEAKIIKSLGENDFQTDIISNCNPDEVTLLNRCFILDPRTNKRYVNIPDQNDVNTVIEVLKRINYDTRWIKQYERNICKPFLIVQFNKNKFYNDDRLTALFDVNSIFPEPSLDAFTFLIEVELIHAFYSEDIALYRMVNTDQDIINKMPSISISYATLLPQATLFCLQASPSGTNLGRMINESRIEGILDHHTIMGDRIGGNYIMKGIRYLLKGYFRFGSSGAPYFVFEEETNSFKVIAIQSEASPIQLSIKNDRNGNFQYVNAIASPVSLIRNELEKLIINETNTES
jgi:hypothetical protein